VEVEGVATGHPEWVRLETLPHSDHGQQLVAALVPLKIHQAVLAVQVAPMVLALWWRAFLEATAEAEATATWLHTL
jgi:hypothetical protein